LKNRLLHWRYVWLCTTLLGVVWICAC